jgi:alkylation response protein AidB-like acyl-CoA dehydrogenase
MTPRPQRYPADRETKRRALLDAVEMVREAAIATSAEAEQMGTLPEAVVKALDEAGLFGLKVPAELGGAEADPVTQIDVIEKMAYIEPSVGWCMFINSTGAGWVGAFLPEESVSRVFTGGRIPHVAGVGSVRGARGVAVEGGYRVSGLFQFASGSGFAEWLVGAFAIEDDAGGTVEQRFFLVPVDEARLHENWQVAGLKGTSSGDFSLDDVVVPEAMTWDWRDLTQGRPKRGGPIFRLGAPAFTANEHGAFALGVARRALDLVTEQALSKRRGTAGAATLIADRQVFQRFVGRADLQLKAARALLCELHERAWQEACAGHSIEPDLASELRAASVLATDIGIDVTSQALRYAGGSGLYLDNMLQRCFRDIVASGQHFAVSDLQYEAHGMFKLGMGQEAPRTGTR